MTKRHFEALADALALTRPAGYPESLEQWQADVRAVVDVCAASNPRFDRERFVKACEER